MSVINSNTIPKLSLFFLWWYSISDLSWILFQLMNPLLYFLSHVHLWRGVIEHLWRVPGCQATPTSGLITGETRVITRSKVIHSSHQGFHTSASPEMRKEVIHHSFSRSMCVLPGSSTKGGHEAENTYEHCFPDTLKSFPPAKHKRHQLHWTV